MVNPATSPIEKPQNGLAGLKHIRHDIVAGIVVSLVSLPLSSGIAIASGVPPVYGLISAIVAGLLVPLIGGCYVTISGPAAGLAPALMAIMITMGGAGDAESVGAGYQFLLVIIFMVGAIQIAMSLLKLARFCAIIPVSVVEGMLASIGMLIIVKQLPKFFGYNGKVHAHEFFQYFGELPTFVQGMTKPVFLVSISTLVLLFWLGSLKNVRFLKVIPPQLIAVVFGVILGTTLDIGSLGHGFLISLPETPFNGCNLPNFSAMIAREDLWYAAIIGIVTLTMIDGIESLATAMAVDRIDPYKRKSDPNRVLLAMGVSNIASSLVGGLTIIPGGVKSKTNIASGGRTLWANFTNAVCLMIYLCFARDVINLIPMGVLSAILIYTGWKMCEPMIWKHMHRIGKEQLVIFAFTIACTLLTDLLWGIVAGVVAKLVLNLYLYHWSAAHATTNDSPQSSHLQKLADLFANPVSHHQFRDGIYTLHLDKPLVCFNSMKLSQELDRIPEEVTLIRLHLHQGVALVDHSSCENLWFAVQQFADRNIDVEIAGLDEMKPMSDYHSSMRVNAPGWMPATVPNTAAVAAG